MSIVRTFTLSALAVTGVLAVGCGKPSGGSGAAGSASTTSASPAPKGGSCFEEKVGICHEFAENPLGVAEGLCTDLYKGTFKKEGCPTKDLVGTCALKDGDKKFYYFGNAEAAWVSDAKKECEESALDKGTFTEAPGAEEAAKEKGLPATSMIAGSCVDPDGSRCEDHVGGVVDVMKDLCKQAGNTWSDSPCPTEDLQGSCLTRGMVTRYYKPMTKLVKASKLQSYCEESGLVSAAHWYPAPGFDPTDAPSGKAAGGKAKAKKK